MLVAGGKKQTATRERTGPRPRPRPRRLLKKQETQQQPLHCRYLPRLACDSCQSPPWEAWAAAALAALGRAPCSSGQGWPTRGEGQPRCPLPRMSFRRGLHRAHFRKYRHTPPAFCPPHGQVLHESIQYGLPMQHSVHPGTQFPAGGLTFLGCVRDWTQPCCLLRTLFPNRITFSLLQKIGNFFLCLGDTFSFFPRYLPPRHTSFPARASSTLREHPAPSLHQLHDTAPLRSQTAPVSSPQSRPASNSNRHLLACGR